ncbi:PLD nuclease N-terminal domain-containing protein [Bacteroidota bacterium]
MFGPSQLLIVFLLIVLPVLALIDVLKHEFTGNNKLIWVVLIIFTLPLGAILYYFIGRSQQIKP